MGDGQTPWWEGGPGTNPWAALLKSAEEIAALDAAAKLASSILAEVERACAPGVRTRELDELTAEALRRSGAGSLTRGYEGFPGHLCTSVNEEVTNSPPSKRKLKDGDLLKLNLSLLHGGFAGDAASSIVVGKGDALSRDLVSVAHGALDAALSKVSVANTLGDLGAAVTEYVKTSGFGLVREFGGHGIGRALRERPFIANVGVRGQGAPLRSGLVLVAHVLLNAGSPDVEVRSAPWRPFRPADDWTVVTVDGSRSAQAKATVALTDAGLKILNLSRRQDGRGK